MGGNYLELVKDSNKHFDIADHMLSVTYPLVNDTKLILTIIDNLYSALIYGVDALIDYNYYYKKISSHPTNIDSKIEMFKLIALKNGFDRKSFVLIKDLKSLVEHRKNSPMEFSRSGSHVLADRNYRLKMVNLSNTKKYVEEVKVFIDKLNSYFKYNKNQKRFLNL